MEMRIAVVAVSFTYHFTRTLHGVLSKSAKPGQTLVEHTLVRRTDTDFKSERMMALLQWNPKPDAVITICYPPTPEALRAFRAVGVPVVIIDEQADGASTVAVDNVEVGRMAARHLLGANRKSLALVCGNTSTEKHYNAVLRRRGFEQVLAEKGMTLPPERVFEVTEYTRKDGEEAMIELLERGRGMDALFCAAGDGPAVGILAAARERKVAVPKQVAVLSVDDLPTAGITEPPLSTIRQPVSSIAEEALRLVSEEREVILEQPKTVLIKPEMVLRASA
jgi:LacI family transcriptional regulator